MAREIAIKIEEFLFNLERDETFTKSDLYGLFPPSKVWSVEYLFRELQKENIIEGIGHGQNRRFIFKFKELPERFKKYRYRTGLTKEYLKMEKARKKAQKKNNYHKKALKMIGKKELIPLLQKI